VEKRVQTRERRKEFRRERVKHELRGSSGEGIKHGWKKRFRRNSKTLVEKGVQEGELNMCEERSSRDRVKHKWRKTFRIINMSNIWKVVTLCRSIPEIVEVALFF